MTKMDVITAGSGDTYRIELVYLDGDQAYGLPRTTTALRPVNRRR